jgi:hypothetical protein
MTQKLHFDQTSALAHISAPIRRCCWVGCKNDPITQDPHGVWFCITHECVEVAA